MKKNDWTTLVSCRIDNKTIKAIDKFCEKRSYLSRSGIINMALKRIFSEHDDWDIYDFLYGNLPLKEK